MRLTGSILKKNQFIITFLKRLPGSILCNLESSLSWFDCKFSLHVAKSIKWIIKFRCSTLLTAKLSNFFFSTEGQKTIRLYLAYLLAVSRFQIWQAVKGGRLPRKKEKGLAGTKVALCLNFTLGSSSFNLSHAYHSNFCCHQALLLSNFTKRNSDIEQPRPRCPLTRIIQMGVVLWRATVSSDFFIVSTDDLEIYFVL